MQRYHYDADIEYLHESPNGEWVRYKDALSIQAADKERIAILEAALRIIADGVHDGPNSFRHVARSALGSGGDEQTATKGEVREN